MFEMDGIDSEQPLATPLRLANMPHPLPIGAEQWPGDRRLLDPLRRVSGLGAALLAVALGLLPALLGAQPSGSDIYVSPTGRAGATGSIQDPLDLRTALAGGKARPGQTIWMRGGAYPGPFTSNLKGSASAVITMRSYPGERAVLVDNRAGASGGTLNVRGEWTVYRDFNITNVNPDRKHERPPRPMGIEVLGPNTKFINLVIHDVGVGIGFWRQAVDSEVYGCIIFNGGQFDNSEGGRGHGHGIYTQNNTGTKQIVDNIITSFFGWGLHIYPNPGELKGYEIVGNAIYDNGRWAGDSVRYNNLIVNGYGSFGPERITIANNYLYHSPSQRALSQFSDADACLQCADSVSSKDLTVRDNYIVNGLPSLFLGGWKNAVVTGNTIAGSDFLAGLAPGALSKMSGGSWDRNRYIVTTSASRPFGLNGDRVDFQQWRSGTGYDANSEVLQGRPSGPEVFVRPNQYEPGRAHIIVLNWNRQDRVDVDVSGVLNRGDRYEVRNAADYLGEPVSSGTYNGGALSLPLMQLPVTPALGMRSSEIASDDEFGVFVVTNKPVDAEPALPGLALPSRSRSAVSRSQGRAQASQDELDKFVGLYRTSDGGAQLRIERTGATIYAVALSEPGAPRYRLFPLSASLYRVDAGAKSAVLEFRIDNGRAAELKVTEGGNSITLLRSQ